MTFRIVLAGVVAAGLAGGYLWSRPIDAQSGGVGGVEVTLSRSGDGHFYADALVNGKPVRFLVDTGASAVALSEKDAAAAGLPVDRSQYSYLGDGAAGMVRGQKVTLDKVAVGDIAEDKVEAVIVANADTSLLGMPFLNALDEITIRKSEMTLRDSS
jgi:aspartyl protease family protein